MKFMFGLLIATIGAVLIMGYCERNRNPYEEGMHFDYKIVCENGFTYKVMRHGAVIQVLNSDGTPLRCGQKIH